jgi:hypothetical protein
MGWLNFNSLAAFSAADLADCSVAGTNSGGMVCAANNYTAGVGGNAAALAASFDWIDNDIRRGTRNGNSQSATLACFASNSDASCVGAGNPNGYITWETIAASYDAGRTYRLEISNYEGNLQAAWPTSTDCSTLKLLTTSSPPMTGGFPDATTCTNTLGNMMKAYRLDPRARILQYDQFRQFAGLDSSSPTFGLLCHSRTNSVYQFEGKNPIDTADPYALMNGTIYGPLPYFQLYYGVQDYVNLASGCYAPT